MSRYTLCRFVCCVVLAVLAFGQTQVITLKSGARVQGEVTRINDRYEVRLPSGITVVFPVDDVESIEVPVTPQDEFAERKAEIDPDDPDQRYRLADWAFEQNLLEHAREELLAALELDPEHERSALLMRQVARRLEEREPPEEDEDEPTTRPGPTGLRGLEDEWLVDSEDIYRIRRAELRSDDSVVVRYRDNALRRFIERMEGRREFREERFADTFRGWERMRQVEYMLDELEDPQGPLASDILIESDPQFMVDFRSRVWPVVARHCASTQCHGGDRAEGDLRLFNIRGRRSRIDYTNFVLLTGYVGEDGGRMIDRDTPEMSMLIQYMLPRDQAEYKHPTRISPVFRSREAAEYQRLYQWIDALRGPPHPRYDLEYEAPFDMTLRFRRRPAFLRDEEEDEEDEEPDE